MLKWKWGYRYLFETVLSFPSFPSRRRITGACGSSIFNYLRKLCTISHSLLYQFTFPLAVHKRFFFHSLSPTLVCLFDNHNCNKCELISWWFWFAFPCWINDVEHLFMYLLVICIFFLKTVYSAHFLTGCVLFLLFVWCSIVWVICIFYVLIPYQTYDLWIFSPIPWVALLFCCTEAF